MNSRVVSQRLGTVLKWGLCVLALGLGSSPDSAHGASPRAVLAEITGEIQLWGCTAEPGEVALRAERSGVFVPGRSRGKGVRTGGRRSGRLTGTADPHVLSFRIPGVRAGQIYTLGIRARSETCRDMRWQGPQGGLVMAGDERPVSIEGFAIRSRLEVLGTAQGRRAPTWVGADHLDFANPETASRAFRWFSDLPGTTGGELQIATERFPAAGRDQGDCANPSGLVHRETVSFDPRGWADVAPVDLNRLLAPGRGDGFGVTQQTYDRLLRGAPLYARVVPQTRAEGGEVTVPRCDPREDGFSGWVVMANLPALLPSPPSPDPPPANPSFVLGAGNRFDSGGVATHPTTKEVCYKVIKPHLFDPNWSPGSMDSFKVDPFGAVLMNAGHYGPGKVAQPTDYPFCLPWGGGGGGGGGFLSSLVDDLGDLVTGVIDATAAMVNELSKLWNQIKKAAVSAAAEALDEIPWVDCGPGSLCRDGVAAGVDMGLVAMGLPPSLPDFDALVNEGVAYLEAKVVDEVAAQTGIPPVVVQQVVDNVQPIVQKTTVKMNEARGGPDPKHNWYLPWDGLDPARLKVNLWRSLFGPEPPSQMGMIPNKVWFSGLVSIPRGLPTLVFPSGPPPLAIPVLLRPNMGGLPAPKPKTYSFDGKTYELPFSQHELGVWYRDQWRKARAIKTPCTHYELWGGDLVSSGSLEIFIFQEEILSVNLHTFSWPAQIFNDAHYSVCAP